jgi:hypothetical protein
MVGRMQRRAPLAAIEVWQGRGCCGGAIRRGRSGGRAKNEKLFDTADCIVMYMDGGGGHPAIQPARMKVIQKQLDRGAGWVNLHYAVEYPVKQGDRDIATPVKGWLGGYYETGYSINPH